MTLRTGLIGFGLAGRYFHAPFLRLAGFDVAAVVTSRRDEVHSVFPQADVLPDVDSLLGRNDIDLVVIASPTQAHYGQARAALEAGKHVVVDKPVAVTAEEARTLAQLARERGRVLSVFHNRRWDADFLTLRKLIAEDRLGEINGYHVRWDRYRPEPSASWRNLPDPASGMVYDLGSHLIDHVLVLFGRPDWVQADAFTQREGARTDDGFEILMAKGKLRITLGVSYLASDGGWRFRVHGSRASFLKAELDPQEDQSLAGMQPDDPRFGVEDERVWGKVVYGATGKTEIVPSERGCWIEYYRGVRASLEQGLPPPVTADQAAEVIEIIEAVYRSAREGRRIALQ
jgi:Predicted dehydrogenases and related proteins